MVGPQARVILHADMDAFYASIEQRDRPELRGKPVIVGATSRRGVVAAASYEAREFGVRSAMPGFRARQLCPQGVFLGSDMARYAAVSSQVHEIFEEFTPVVEPLALDEAFLDISGSLGRYGSALALAQALQARVLAVTRLHVSCGVACNKLVAKIACTLSKPKGLLWVPPEQTRALLDPLPVRFLWGVGPVAGKALVTAGYTTLGEIANAELAALQRVLGDRAQGLQALARGEDERPVEAERAAKSYGEENTFEQDVLARETITRALTSHAHGVARRLRHDALAGRTITIKVKLGRARGSRTSRSAGAEEEPRYPLLSRSRTLQDATSDANVIRHVALSLWDEAAIAEPVRLLGVAVSNLGERSERGGEQLSLFGAESAPQEDRLGPALDAIRARFGEGAIRVATGDPEKLTPSLRKKRGL